MDCDLLVVGAGAAGLAAARAARRHGARVVLVTDGPPGGDCTFTGCVPSKTLLDRAARGVPFADAMAAVAATVATVAAGETAAVLRAEGIEVVDGRARLAGRSRVAVDGRSIDARRVVIATGARPALPPVPGLDTVAPLTTETVFALTRRPTSLLVLGGGPVGVELSQAFARLGTQVTLVEVADRLLPAEEPAASALVTAALRADGVDVVTGAVVVGVEGSVGDGGGVGSARVVVRLGAGRELDVEQVLVAAGRRPSVEGLGLAAAGVVTDEGGRIVTDVHLRTTVPGVYAAGDVTGRSPYTHAADEMGRTAAANALARVPWRRFREDRIPAVTYTSPEVARVGLTESAAAASVPGARVAYLPLDEIDRAVTSGRTDGYVKLVTGPRRGSGHLGGGRLVGATIVAERAGEMIALPTLVLAGGLLPARLALAVQAYPTWTVGVRQAAGQLFVETGGRHWRPARPDGG